MPEHEEACPDRTLAVRRGLFAALYRFGALEAARWLTACLMAPDQPALALAQGELLVSTPRRVLAFTAHPDDLEFFCGGTLRRMALAGSRITAVVLTDGEKWGNRQDLAEQRRAEQWQAAHLQGYEEVHFLGLPDFGLAEDPRLERLLARSWDRAAPEVIFAFDPKELVPRMANRDHKALGRAVLDLARSRVDSGAQVYFYGTRHPDVLVDISPVIADKLRAVRAHRSQMVYLDEAETDGAVRLMARIMAGRSGVAYAEGLFRLL